MSNERYWMEQCSKKDARIEDLTEKLIDLCHEGAYYKGLYISLKESLTEVITIDETFEDILEEGDEDDSNRA